MTDIKAKARAVLIEKWNEVLEAEDLECDYGFLKKLRHDFYIMSEMYEAIFDEEVTGTTLSGVLFEAKEEEV